MKKKIVSVLLATILVFSLAGCKDKNTTDGPIDYSEYVTLGDYKGLTIEVAKADVTDEQLKTKIDSIIKEKTTHEELKEGKVVKGNTINLDYKGLLDGKAFDNGSATGAVYTVGGSDSGKFIDDLDNQLVGLEVGKQYDLNCKFPDDYSNNKDLAGKSVVFQVKVNSIQGKEIVPEWNDEFVASYSKDEYKTVKDYEGYLKKQLEEENLKKQENEYQQSLWDKILKNGKVSDYPEDKLNDLSDDYYEDAKNYYSYYAQQYGVDYDTFLSANKMTDDTVKEQAMKSAKSQLDYMMTAMVIAKTEGIEIPEEEYESKVNSYAETLTYDSADKFKDEFGETFIKENFLFDKVCEWLYDNNKMVATDKVEETTTSTEGTTTAAETTAAE